MLLHRSTFKASTKFRHTLKQFYSYIFKMSLIFQKTSLQLSKIHIFTIDGEYLMRNGMKEGSAIGKVLKIIEEEWITNGFKISTERVKEIIKSNN